jgi:hypothetical protein
MYTELEIVNAMLAVNSLRIVTTLETLHPDVVQAREALTSVNKDFQTLGWWFNKEDNMKLLPALNGEIIFPQSALDVQINAALLASSPPRAKSRYVQRGGKFYDNVEHTYDIGKPLYVDVVTYLPVTDLPSIAAVYLKKYATWKYFADDDGDQIKVRTLAEERDRAWGFLIAKQLSHLGTNVLDSPAAASLNYRIRQLGMASNPNFPGGR